MPSPSTASSFQHPVSASAPTPTFAAAGAVAIPPAADADTTPTTADFLTPAETETAPSPAAAASCRPAHKRALSSDRDAQSPAESNASTLPTRDGSVVVAPEDQRTKKRRTAGAGTSARGVANLTPEQLAKKRANGTWFAAALYRASHTPPCF